MKIEERWDIWRIIFKEFLSSYNIKRKRFLKRMMWAKVLVRIKIVLMLRYHPLISTVLEYLILIPKVIKDGPQGVFNSSTWIFQNRAVP